MSTKEQASEIALEYLDKNNLSNGELTEIIDKIYKWVITAKISGRKCVIEVSKSNSTVIKF